jgi:hypothetical protein
MDLIWALVYRVEVEPITCEGETGIGAILHWTKAMISAYPGVDFFDFKKSFQDGLIFACILHQFNPGLIDLPTVLYVSKKIVVFE